MAAVQYFIRIRGRIMGPFDWPQLRSLRDRGQLNRFHEVSTDRRTWTPASSLGELFETEEIQEVEAVPAAKVPPAVLAPASQYTAAELNPQRRFRPKAARPGGSRALLWGGLAVGGLVLVIITAVGIVLLLSWKNSNSGGPIANVLSGNPTIASATDEQGIAGAVGLVVAGARVLRPDGSQIDAPAGQGSGFCVTAQGHLLTNRHVVEKTWNLQNAELLRKKYREELLVDLKPKVWVFFGKEKYEAEIVHVSEDYDLAILKIDRPHTPFFRMAGTDDFKRGVKVIACGFPGAAQEPVSMEEEVRSFSKSANVGVMKHVQDYFKARDFEFGATDGSISRVFSEDAVARRWIQHNASINPGNSGGPLINDRGTVVGINTRRTIEAGSDQVAQGIFYSLTMPQLRREIEKHIGSGVVWE